MAHDTEYPKMLYGADGASITVKNASEEKAAGAGWSADPSDEHRSPASHAPLIRSDQQPFVEAVARRVVEMLRGEGLAPPAEPVAAEPAPRQRRSETPTESGE